MPCPPLPASDRLAIRTKLGGPLDRETFAALSYNWGKAPRAFAQAADLRLVPIPASTASYALRFKLALREARERARADNGIPRARSP